MVVDGDRGRWSRNTGRRSASGQSDPSRAHVITKCAAPYLRQVERDEDNGLVLCCLLWARDGLAAELSRYEDRVLAILNDHGGRVLQRAIGTRSDGQPDEVQFIEFDRESSLDAFMNDPCRQELANERDRVIARTVLFPVIIR